MTDKCKCSVFTKPHYLSRNVAWAQSPLTCSAFFCSTTTPSMRTPSQPAYWCQAHTGTSSISGDCAELDVLQRALDLLVLLLIQLLYEGSKSFILNHGSRSRVLTKPLGQRHRQLFPLFTWFWPHDGLGLEVVQDGLRLDKLRHHLILYRLMVYYVWRIE